MNVRKELDELEPAFHAYPVSEDESVLAGMLFERITELYPDWKMGDRTDLAMAMFAVVKRWGHNLDLTSHSHTIVKLGGEDDRPNC